MSLFSSQSQSDLKPLLTRSLSVSQQAFPDHSPRRALRNIRSSGSLPASRKFNAFQSGEVRSLSSLSADFAAPPDLAGNTLATARSIAVTDTPQTFSDFVGTADPADYYQFTLTSRQDLKLSLTGLSADADVSLLNHRGSVIQSPVQDGLTPESIEQLLNAGTYYVRVSQFSGDTTYDLQLATPETVSITAIDGNASEVPAGSPANSGRFRISRTGDVTEALTVNYTIGGTATQGLDYSLPRTLSNVGSVTIPAGQNSVALPINAIDDNLQESLETVIVTLTSGSYALGSSTSASVSIDDNDSPAVTDPIAGMFNLSRNSRINTLLASNKTFWNTSQNGGKITYSFYRNSSGKYYSHERVWELNETIKSSVRNIMSMISSHINVDFVEVADTPSRHGVLRYMFSNLGGGGGYAYAYYPDSDPIGGDVHLSSTNESDPINRFSGGFGTHGYMTLVHETLHALGIKHPGNYNGSGPGEGPFLPGGEDNTTNTLMSYNFAGNGAITPMAYDIEALQYLYGSRSSRSSDTLYSFSTVHSFMADGQFFGSAAAPLKQSIWDSGGIDTLDFSGLSAGSYRFDLRQNGIITTQSAFNSFSYSDRSGSGTFTTSPFGTTIAFKTAIENLVNSSGNDSIFANSSANRFRGYGSDRTTGRDTYFLTDASDVLELGDFSLSSLTATMNGRDLLLGLGSDRSIRISNYYGTDGTANNAMRIQTGSNTYVYSPTSGWQSVTSPGMIAAAAVPLEAGVTALPLVAPNQNVPVAYCACSFCTPRGRNPLQQTLRSAIRLA